MAKNPGTSEPAPDVPLVVIVDDDASVRQSTCRLVRSFGYRAQSFGSGEEFLTSSPAGETACLLLDVRMPGMDGLEVQRRLVERGARVPIVFLTARASDDEERRARSAGAVEFLRKPVGQASLRRVLENVFSPRGGVRGDRDGE
jgi:FixJ family two-component response regulator